VVLGGSHDSTYSTVRGLCDASGGQSVGCSTSILTPT